MNDWHTIAWIALACGVLGAACHSSRDRAGTPPSPPPAPLAISGVVSDGPVLGGTLFVYTAPQVVAALAAADAADDRRAALAAAESVLSVVRDPADGDAFAFDVPADLAGEALFLVFDHTDAEDETFLDAPPSMQSLGILPASGSRIINVSLHTTAIARLVRAELDPDGDGTPIAAADIEAALQAATLNVLDALARDEDGEPLFASGESPIDTPDTQLLHAASEPLGLAIRTLAGLEALAPGEVLAALAADAGDGAVDGEIPAGLDLDPEIRSRLGALAAFLRRADDEDYRAFAMGPCSQSAVSLRRACAADVVDDLLEGRAICAGIADDADRAACLAELAQEQSEAQAECDDVLDARLDVCAAVNDAAYEPAFGPAFAASFVDPRDIGGSVEPNPYFPLIPGATRSYEKTFVDEDGEPVTETLTITVTDRIKRIDGIPCLVVNDLEDSTAGEGEDTDDWFAQDVDGNVWYCGEISRELETFEGDEPEAFEVVSIDGSWKAGRDGAKAGILIPAAPETGAVIRQELLYGEAEDVIEIVALDASESAPGGSCVADCLQTRDFTPLEPGGEELKFYAPGIGLIVELDPESGERLELLEYVP